MASFGVLYLRSAVLLCAAFRPLCSGGLVDRMSRFGFPSACAFPSIKKMEFCFVALVPTISSKAVRCFASRWREFCPREQFQQAGYLLDLVQHLRFVITHPIPPFLLKEVSRQL